VRKIIFAFALLIAETAQPLNAQQTSSATLAPAPGAIATAENSGADGETLLRTASLL
jgi:hypothetical protein